MTLKTYSIEAARARARAQDGVHLAIDQEGFYEIIRALARRQAREDIAAARSRLRR